MRIEMILVIFAALMLSSCGNYYNEENENLDAQGNNQKTLALDDEFTKDFIASDQEVVEGYYLFKSHTDGYTVHFPINASMDKAVYERVGNQFESVGFVENDEIQNLSFIYNIYYDDQPRANDIEFKLDMFDTYIDYKGDFKDYIRNRITYYYAEDKFEFEGKESSLYFSYIKPPLENKGIQFIGSVLCIDYEKPCKQDSKEAKEKVLNIMHSIDVKSRIVN
ncbi:hypothetical protein LG307_08185 [Sutcliffiella horikoshii]|uniref:hypothetical protein n=1 Tax=Sutcliffiella horikoshii TaxID=79883 RepID=UPI00384B788E